MGISILTCVSLPIGFMGIDLESLLIYVQFLSLGLGLYFSSLLTLVLIRASWTVKEKKGEEQG